MKMKILLIGRTQDKQLFLQDLEPKPGQKQTYFLEGNDVQLLTTFEQAKPEWFNTKLLDGYHAVIYVRNPKDNRTSQIIDKIPESMLYTFDTASRIESKEYVRARVRELSQTPAYVYEEPVRSSNFFDILYRRVSAYFMATPTPLDQEQAPEAPVAKRNHAGFFGSFFAASSPAKNQQESLTVESTVKKDNHPIFTSFRR